MIETIHTAVEGRARFKVTGLYRSQPLKQVLESELSQRQEIHRVSASVLTGNLLVEFNSHHTPQDIAALIKRIVGQHKKQTRGKASAKRTDAVMPNGLPAIMPSTAPSSSL